MNKSYVTMETKLCEVCGKEHDTNNILMDRMMRDKFGMKTCTGIGGFCPEHQKQIDDGFVFLIEVDNKIEEKKDTLKNSEANRTGMVVTIKKEILKEIIEREPENISYIDKDFTEALQKMTKSAE